MLKRSLTLLETMIAIVLILAMAALVVPSLLSSMEERTFDSAADVTNDHLMMARAHAQATGSPVEVTYRADRSKVFARFFRAGQSDERLTLSVPHSPEHDSVRNLGPLGPESSDVAMDDQTEITEPWAIRDISPGVRIVNHRPSSAHQDESSAEPNVDVTQSDDEQTLEDLGAGEEVRLAIFMPDGSALMGDTVWLNDEKGRVGMLTINPWSGIPIFQRLIEGSDSSTRKNQTDAPHQSKKIANSTDDEPELSDRGRSRARNSRESDQDDETSSSRRNREPDFSEH
jgi:type II secretory pathway pseudopilin PulG